MDVEIESMPELNTILRVPAFRSIDLRSLLSLLALTKGNREVHLSMNTYAHTKTLQSLASLHN